MPAGLRLGQGLWQWPVLRCWLTRLTWLAPLLCLPQQALALACSAYQGQVSINELRIGRSNGSDSKNQIELFNPGNVPQSVWSTWQLVLYYKDGSKTAVKKGGYYLSSGFIQNTDFIYNNNKSIYLRNRTGRLIDVALVDAGGNFIDYVAMAGQIQALPGCLGTPKVASVTSSSDTNGDVARPVDGGSWPAAVANTSFHTIGLSNACNASGSDLVVNNSANTANATIDVTSVTYTVAVSNNSCFNTVAGIVLTDTGISTTNFTGLVKTPSQGTTSQGASALTWTVGSLAPGISATLTISGKPHVLGLLNTTAAITTPSSGLVATSNDSDTETVNVADFNYVSFDLASASLTEGVDASYSALISARVVPTKKITVNYSVSGSAGAGDTNLPSTGSVVIDPLDPNTPDGTSIDFTITNDNVTEPAKTITLTITSVVSIDTAVRLDSAKSVMGLTLIDDDTGPDHYELSLPSASLACLPSTVTVTACSNSSSPCTSAMAGLSGKTVTLATSAGSLAATTLSLDASGVASTTLSHPGAADGAVVTVSLSGEQATGNNPRKCCPNGSSCAAGNSCASSFASAGLVVAAAANGAATTVPTQTAGSASAALVLRAVKTSTTTQACEAALAGANTVNWAYQCNNPSTCSGANLLTLTGSTATPISRNDQAATPAYTAVNMVFDANGNAPFSFDFADVGQLTLLASKTVGGALLSGSSNAFVSRPANFAVSAVAQTAAPALANPAATSASGARFVKAGEAFAATITALTSGGATTPNFGRESPAEGVLLSPTLLLPAAGNAGTLSNATIAGTSFASGVASVSNLAYSEVGIIQLAARIADADYLGTGQVSGSASANIGRFVPSRFTLTPGTASGACSAAFTYLGQDGLGSSFNLRAENSSGTVTQNYAGSFAKLDTTAWASFGFSGVGLPTGATLGAGATAASGAWVAGQSTVQAWHLVSRPAAPVAPASLVLWAAPTDSDAVSATSTAVAAATPLRYGRLRLSNAFGSASAALQLAVAADYWSGNSWVLNSADSCTTVPAASVVRSNPRDAFGAASTASSSASAVTLSAGQGLLSLSAPSPAGSSVSFDLALNLGSGAADLSCQASHPTSTGAARPWLRSRNGSCAATYDRDPGARASFGIFAPETRRTVHAREMF